MGPGWEKKAGKVRARRKVSRGVVGAMCLSIVPLFIELLPIGDFTALSSLSIIWVVILARFFLNEQIRPKIYVFIPILIISVILITRPSIIFNKQLKNHNDANKLNPKNVLL